MAALVELALGAHVSGDTRLSASVLVDESAIDADGTPDPDALFRGPIEIVVAGPGVASILVWKGHGGSDQGRAPWRTTDSLFPGGMGAGTWTVPVGGPVRKLSDISWRTGVWH